MKKIEIKNYIILIPILILNIISLLNMINAKLISNTYESAFLKQIIWFFIGYLIIYIISKINIKKIFKYTNYFYYFSIILLIITLIFGEEINGAKCWLNISFISFQPSELVKITLPLYLMSIINNSKSKTHKDEFILVTKLIFITLLPCILVFLEPDTGAIINYFLIFIIALIYAKLNKWWYISFFTIIFIFIGSLFISYFFYQNILIKLVGTSIFYRMDRIINFTKGNSYQLENALTTIGNATFLGCGTNKIILYIPEAPTDFLFAFSIGNYGLLSAFLIILSFLFIDIYLIYKEHNLKNKNFKMFISSFLIIFIFHQIYNISINIGLLPIMGIPLPFLSYGGTSTIINFIFIGIILKIINKKATI